MNLKKFHIMRLSRPFGWQLTAALLLAVIALVSPQQLPRRHLQNFTDHAVSCVGLLAGSLVIPQSHIRSVSGVPPDIYGSGSLSHQTRLRAGIRRGSHPSRHHCGGGLSGRGDGAIKWLIEPVTTIQVLVCCYCYSFCCWSLLCIVMPPSRLLRPSNTVATLSVTPGWTGGLNAPVADFAAQLHQKSGWDPRAVSPVGAQGLAQFMPTTATWISDTLPELKTSQPFNPAWSIRALTRYDRWIWQRITAADDCQRMAMTLSGYNGGLGWVQRDQKLAAQRGLDHQRWFGHVATVNAGRSAANWRENRHYQKRILLELAPRYLMWGGRSCAEPA